MKLASTTLYDIFIDVSGLEEYSDLTCVIAYENDIKPTPVDEPIIAFSVKDCVIGPTLTTVEENGKIVETNEREVMSTISIDIYQPYSKGAQHALSIYERIATTLLEDTSHKVMKSECKEAEYDKTCQAIVLKSTFVFKDIIS